MAKKEEAPKVVLERVYNIPLRQQTLKVPPFKKANKAVKTVREFITKHMKSDNIVLGKYLNLHVWKHGARNPPHHVKINAIKDDKGKVTVELVDAPKEPLKAEAKKPAKEAKAESPETKEEMQAEKLEKEVEQAHEKKAEEAKKVEKEEIKDLKKEHPKQHAPKAPKEPKSKEMRKKEMIPQQGA